MNVTPPGEPTAIERLFQNITFANHLTLANAALFYAHGGIPVFPLAPNTKIPLLSGSWKKYATTDLKIIKQWWIDNPDANIALCMGGPILAIDCDMKNGINLGWLDFQKFEPGECNAPIQITPSGGCHIIKGNIPNLINFTHKGENQSIDMRTDGGYILGAPSLIDGIAYYWAQPGPINKLNGVFGAQCVEWSNQSSIDKSIGQPDPTPYDELKSLDLLPLKEKHFLFLETGEVHDDFNNDRSAALMGVTTALYQIGLCDEDVLGYLESSAGAMECAIAHAGKRQPLVWLWTYTCLKARKTTPIIKTAQEAFKNVSEDPDMPTVSEKERLIKIAESLTENQEDEAVLLYRNALHISNAFASKIASIIQTNIGILKGDLQKDAKQMGREIATTFRNASEDMPRKSGQSLSETHPCSLPAPAFVDSWDTLVGRYVYIITENKWFDRYTRETLSPESLNSAQAHIMEKLSFSGEEGLKLRATDALVARNDTLKVDSRSYWPGMNQDLIHVDKIDAINTWRPTSLQAIQGDITLWWTLFCHIFPDEQARDRILDWMAFILQHPEIKINYALVIGGGERIGKDTIFLPLLHGVGFKNMINIQAEALDEKYADHFVGKKLVVIQEIYQATFKDSTTVENKLKNYLASPPDVLDLRRLGEKNTQQMNLIQLLIYTNHRVDALHLSSRGDRYLCEWSPAKQLSPEFYKSIYDWFEHEQGTEKVYDFLMRRDIGHFDPKGNAPVTEWRTELRGSGKSDMEYKVEDIIYKIHQENERARTLLAKAIQDGIAITNANAHLYHEQIYISPQMILDKLGVPMASKTLSTILNKLGTPRLKGGADNRMNIPREFDEPTFAGAPGKDKFKSVKKSAIYVIETDGENALNPSLEQLRLGLCPRELINAYLMSLEK